MNAVDFDLHGVAGIRVLGASAADAAAVARQLGPIEAPLAADPDLVIRFVDSLETRGSLTYLGLDDAAFSEDAFLVLRARHKARARVQIAFPEPGEPLTIVCERGLPAVPLLVSLLNLVVLGRGALPLHAAAFDWRGTGVLCTGWSKGGKTEALLAFMAEGASYVGDEWVYLGEGGAMFGIPEPVRVWNWHLRSAPHYRDAATRGERLRLGALEGAARVLDRATRGSLGRSAPGRLLRRASPLLEKQLGLDLTPEALFGAERCTGRGSLDRLFFVASWERPEVVVRPVDPLAVADRMVFSLQEEELRLRAAYHRYRFAFPERPSSLFESSEVRQRELLRKAFEGVRAYEIVHPYPVPLAALFEAMAPHCE